MVSDYNIKSVLRNSLFKGVPEHFFKRFYNPKNFLVCKEGTIIYSPGEDSLYLYLVVQGEIKIKYSGQKQLINKYLYDFFGETEMRKGTKRISSSVANIDSILYKINFDELQTLCSGNITINKNLKNKHDIEEPDQKDFIWSELSIPIPEENSIEELDLDLDLIDDNQETFSEVSEDELDLILKKQKNDQEFRKVMKKVGKVEGNDILHQELLGDFSDTDEWRLATD